jgi:hypothetical protein
VPWAWLLGSQAAYTTPFASAGAAGVPCAASTTRSGPEPSSGTETSPVVSAM